MSEKIRRRASDTVISRYGDAVIGDLELLITDAVRSADDERATALDRVLRGVEHIIDSASGRRSGQVQPSQRARL